MDPPPPSTAYHVTLTKQQVTLVKRAAIDLAGTLVYERVIEYSPSRVEIRDWLQASLFLEDSHIKEVAIMGRGIFSPKLSFMRVANDMVARSTLMLDRKIISIYLGIQLPSSFYGWQ